MSLVTIRKYISHASTGIDCRWLIFFFCLVSCQPLRSAFNYWQTRSACRVSTRVWYRLNGSNFSSGSGMDSHGGRRESCQLLRAGGSHAGRFEGREARIPFDS